MASKKGNSSKVNANSVNGNENNNMNNINNIPMPMPMHQFQFNPYGYMIPMNPQMMMQQPNMMMQQPNMMMQQPNMMMMHPQMMMQQHPQFMFQQPPQMAQQPIIQRNNGSKNNNFNNIVDNLDVNNESNTDDDIDRNDYVVMNEYNSKKRKNNSYQKIVKAFEKPIAKSIAKQKINPNQIPNSIQKLIFQPNAIENVNLGNPIVNNLANLFDNVLDNTHINKKQKIDNSFGIDKNNSNVIKALKPIDSSGAHFNKKTHPDEVYNVEFLDGKYETIKAIDISDDSLKSQKLTYNHNIKIALANPMTPPNATNTVIYVRRSVKDKECIDNSIKTQTDACFAYALSKNMKMAAFGYLEDNGISGRFGKNLKNNEIAFWSPHIPNNSTIIVYSPDRWCRNTRVGLEVLDEFSKRNITVHFVSNNIDYNKDITSANRAMIQTELMTAEKQSNDTSEKIKGTHRRLRAEGHVLGKAPYGFRISIINGIRKRFPNEDEKNNIRKIKQKHIDIHENFDDYLRTENIKRNESSVIKFIVRWCVRTGLQHRNNVAFTEYQIKKIVESDI